MLTRLGKSRKPIVVHRDAIDNIIRTLNMKYMSDRDLKGAKLMGKDAIIQFAEEYFDNIGPIHWSNSPKSTTNLGNWKVHAFMVDIIGEPAASPCAGCTKAGAGDRAFDACRIKEGLGLGACNNCLWSYSTLPSNCSLSFQGRTVQIKQEETEAERPELEGSSHGSCEDASPHSTPEGSSTYGGNEDPRADTLQAIAGFEQAAKTLLVKFEQHDEHIQTAPLEDIAHIRVLASYVLQYAEQVAPAPRASPASSTSLPGENKRRFGNDSEEARGRRYEETEENLAGRAPGIVVLPHWVPSRHPVPSLSPVSHKRVKTCGTPMEGIEDGSGANESLSLQPGFKPAMTWGKPSGVIDDEGGANDSSSSSGLFVSQSKKPEEKSGANVVSTSSRFPPGYPFVSETDSEEETGANVASTSPSFAAGHTQAETGGMPMEGITEESGRDDAWAWASTNTGLDNENPSSRSLTPESSGRF